MRLLAAITLGCAQIIACADGGDEHLGCTLVGCPSGFELRATVAHPVRVVHMADVKVCLNGTCRTGKFTTKSGVGKDGRQLPEETVAILEPFFGSRSAFGRLVIDAVPTADPLKSALGVICQWDPAVPPNATSDVVDISVELDGVMLYATHKVIEEYVVSQPNGPECEPTCHYARLSD